MNRTTRRLAPLALGLGLMLAPALVRPASAQTPNPNEAGFEQPVQEEEEGGTDPWLGYASAIVFIGGSIFAICSTARR